MPSLLQRLFHTKNILKNHPDTGEIPPSGELLQRTMKIAWPSMTEAFLMALVSFIDIMMVSKLGESAIAAVGLTGQPRMMFFAAFFALQPAVSALVARRRGEGDRDDAVRTTKLALMIGLGFAVILSICALVFADPIMRLVGSQPDTHEWAVSYFRITVGGIIFAALTMIINAAQRGSGNTKISMRTNLVSNGVNIVFNYLLIGGNFGFPALGVEGAAIATVFGQFCGFVMALISVLHPESFVSLRHKTEKLFERTSLRALGSFWTNTLAEQLILRAGFLLYAVVLAQLGTLAFATHQIAMNFLTISFAFGDGLSVAAVALVGYSLGQGRSDLAKVFGAYCQRIGLICSLAVSLVYVIFGRTLFGMFSQNEQVLRDGTIIMWMMTVIVLLQISQVIFSGCLRGSGDNRFITIVSFINIGIMRPLLAYVFGILLGWGIVGAWAGLILDQAIRLTMTSIRFYRGKWINIKI